MKKPVLAFVLVFLAGCVPTRGSDVRSDSIELAPAEMLSELARLSEGQLGWAERAGAFCFFPAVGRPDFGRLDYPATESETAARLESIDPRFTPVSTCAVSETRVVTADHGSPAYLVWVDSLSASQRKAWGTVMAGPGIGQVRGYVCQIRTDPSVGIESCSVAWFSE